MLRPFGCMGLLLLLASCRDQEPATEDPWRDLSGTIYVLRDWNGGPLGAVDPVTATVRPLLSPSNLWYQTAAAPDGTWLLLQRRGIERLDLQALALGWAAPDEDAAVSRTPAISPDGMHMAWQRTGDSGTNIMLRAADGTPPTSALGPLRQFSATFMQWLNDRELAWISAGSSLPGRSEITALDVRTGGMRIVGRESGLNASYFVPRHATAELIVMVGEPGAYELWLADTGGVLKRRIASLGGVLFETPFSVSPDGRYLAVPVVGTTGGFDLMLIDVATGSLRELPIPGGDEVDPSWTIAAE